MPARPLIFAPNIIFKKTSDAVDATSSDIQQLGADLVETLYAEKGVGIAATMVGELKRVIAIDLMDDGKKDPKIYYNPDVIWQSNETQDFVEASLCFPGIEASIIRPNAITIAFDDKTGNRKEEKAEGFLATVIQHEIDYLNGKVYLDYLKPMKRKMLMQKCQKYQRQLAKGLIHQHGSGCGHNHAPGETCGHQH